MKRRCEATTDIPSTINTPNTELQMVKVHINNIKHITIELQTFTYLLETAHPRTTKQLTQTYNTAHHKHTHSVRTGDVNAHSTLWHSYTDGHRGQQIADVISKSDHITQIHQPECQTTNLITRYHHGVTHCTTGHRGQLNTHYHQTT